MKNHRNKTISKLFSSLVCVFLFLLPAHNIKAQQKQYFQVNAHEYKYKSSDKIEFFGRLEIVVPHDQSGTITLNFPGRTSHQLFDGIMNYLKVVPNLVILEKDSASKVKYRDFDYVGKKDTCKADLICLNYITLSILENKILFSLDYSIYATVNDALLGITKFGEVYSQNDVPFNYYQFVQPASYVQKTYSSGGLVGLMTKKPNIQHQPGLAYPESIYDPQGNIVNPTNKLIIERLYNSYVTGLTGYLDRYFNQ